MTSGDLAWRMADLLPARIPAADRHRIYVALGCRHFRHAIALCLQAAIADGGRLPVDLIDALNGWLMTLHPDAERAHLSALLQTFIEGDKARTVQPLASKRMPRWQDRRTRM